MHTPSTLRRPAFLSSYRTVLWPLIARNKWSALGISILGILHIAALMWIPRIVQTLFQRASEASRMGSLVAAGEQLLVSASVVTVSSILLERLSAKCVKCDTRTLEALLFSKVLSLRPSSTESLGVGYLASRLRDDIPLVSPLMVGEMAPYVVITMQLFTVIVILWRIDWAMALVSICMALAIALANGFITPQLRRMSEAVQEGTAALNGYVVEAISSLSLLKACVAEDAEQSIFESRSRVLNDNRFRLSVLSRYLSEANSSMGRFGFLFLALVGAWRIESGALHAPGFMSSIVYINILLYSSRSLLNFTPRVAGAMESAKRLGETLALESESTNARTNGLDSSDLAGEIELRGVTFAYEHGAGCVFRNLNFLIPQGAKIGIVGQSGAGKSTLIKLLLGFERPTAGQILIGGHALSDIDLRFARRHIGYVSQGGTAVLRRTVKENIILGCPDASLEAVLRAARAARADTFISSLPRSYDTVIGTDQNALSGGQAQRIALAREFVRRPTILLMDEATSQLDPITERDIIDTVLSVFRSSTCIVVSHRINSLAGFDLILVLEDGAIVAQGSHDQLVNEHGLYQRLINTQNQLLQRATPAPMSLI